MGENVVIHFEDYFCSFTALFTVRAEKIVKFPFFANFQKKS